MLSARRARLSALRRRARAALRDERGFTLMELLITLAIFMIVLVAVFGALGVVSRSATSGQAYANEVQDAEFGIARITHDLRTAYSVVSAQPNMIEFYQWANVNGVTRTKDVEYDCGIPQPGTSYARCMRVESISPAPLPNSATGAPVILRLVNGGINTYCNSNAVFHYTSTTSNGSSAPCTEAAAAAAAINPIFVEVRILVPAKGELTGSLTAGSLTHTTVLDGGAALRNANLVNQAS
jgi:prepilin-type N-terminal cleavage/methylation domain-containing protein